jgi:hypothetical protein
VALVGLATLSEYLFGWDLGIDQLLFKEPPEAAAPFPPDRMAPATALNFLLLASALLLLDVEKRSIHYLSECLALMAGLISLLSLGAYVYNDPALTGGFSYTRMSLHTAPTFLMLCGGILCARPERRLMATITSDSAGGLAARRLLPAAIAVPLLLSWLRLQGERAGLYGLEFGLALFALSNVVIFAVLIWWNARLLNQMDLKRRQTEEKLQTRYQELQTLHEINQDVLKSLDLQTILNQILEKAISIGPFDIGAIRLLDPSGKLLEARASHGYLNPTGLRPLSTHPRLPDGAMFFPRIMSGEEAWVIENLSESQRLRSFQREGVHSAVVVAVLALRVVVGGSPRASSGPARQKGLRPNRSVL